MKHVFLKSGDCEYTCRGCTSCCCTHDSSKGFTETNKRKENIDSSSWHEHWIFHVCSATNESILAIRRHRTSRRCSLLLSTGSHFTLFSRTGSRLSQTLTGVRSHSPCAAHHSSWTAPVCRKVCEYQPNGGFILHTCIRHDTPLAGCHVCAISPPCRQNRQPSYRHLKFPSHARCLRTLFTMPCLLNFL